MNSRIPVAQPMLGTTEGRYVAEALAEGAISGTFGSFLPRFEETFASYCDCLHGISTSGGTPALHLALATLNIGPGDEVLVSTLTNMATLFAISYQGATPVPVDIEPDTLNLDPQLLADLVTPRTKAILVVHLFGHPVDMDPVLALARERALYVVEDCAEAHGATYRGRKVGGMGQMGCFSFYANKIITTGEGGMVTTSDPALADRARRLKGLAFGDKNRFMHTDVGFNYRMTNLQAAIGCAQMERIEQVLQAKRRIAHMYDERLSNVPALQLPVERPWARNVYWMYHVVLKGVHAGARAEIMQALDASGIETREGFIPANLQEIFIREGWTRPEDCPRANAVAYAGFYLPSGPVLTEAQVDRVAARLREIVGAP